MPIRLTDTAITKAVRDVAEAGARRDLADAGCPGLRLRLTPTGARSWVLACRDRKGRMRRFPLGRYPELGISDARSAARALHAKVKHEDVDPIADRRRARAVGAAARSGVGTLGGILDLYEEQVGKRQKAWAQSRRRVDLVFRPMLPRLASELTSADLQLTADSYPARPSASFAVRTIRPALKWAAHRGYCAEALANIRQPEPTRRRRRVLSRGEVAAILPALRASERPHAAALLFMLLTLARREEVVAARWRDVDFRTGVWTIPETKNAEPHSIPLSRQAAELLKGRQAQDAARNALVFATDAGTALGNWDRETKALHEASGTTGWHRHDLRRTGATMLGEMGELPDIVEAALNHTSIRSPLAATYNRSRYRPQVAVALQRLADALDGIEQGAGEIVPLRAG